MSSGWSVLSKDISVCTCRRSPNLTCPPLNYWLTYRLSYCHPQISHFMILHEITPIPISYPQDNSIKQNWTSSEYIFIVDITITLCNIHAAVITLMCNKCSGMVICSLTQLLTDLRPILETFFFLQLCRLWVNHITNWAKSNVFFYLLTCLLNVLFLCHLLFMMLFIWI